MPSSPIQEYLIGLGFKLDTPGAKRFAETLDGTSKAFVKVGETALAASAAVGLAVEKIAAQYEDLYYFSQRTGATIQSLQATAYGFTQIGLSAGDAKGMVDNLAMALRTNPGNSALLRMLGVSGGDANAQAHGLVRNLSHMPFFMASQYAGMFGISPQQLLMMENGLGDLDRAEADHVRRQNEAGLATNDLGEKSHIFMTDLRKLEDEFGILADKIAQDFIKPADAVVKELETVTEWFLKVDRATDGWATTIGALGTAIGGLVALRASLGWIAGLFGGGGAAAEGAAAGEAAAGVAGGAAAEGGWLSTFLGAGSAVLSPLLLSGDADNHPTAGHQTTAQWIRSWFGGSAAGVNGQTGWWTPERQQHAIQALVAGGVSPLGAAGLVSRWMNVESAVGPGSINPTSGAFGIGQWLGARKPGISGDTDFDHQLAYVLRELHSSEGSALGSLNSASTPWDAARGASMYERAHGYNSALGTDDFTGRTAAGISIGAPQTTIHVTGGADPQTTADYVLKGQLGVWDDVFRNAGTTVR